jgi:hypothetical protein
MECYSDIQVDNLKNYGIIKRVFIYVTERCFMFFLLLAFLLLPCTAVFAMNNQEQRGQNARRVARTLFSSTTREQMEAALDESQTSFRSQQRHQRDLPVQYDVQQAWDMERCRALTKSAFDSAATGINADEPEIAELSAELSRQKQHRNCPHT